MQQYFRKVLMTVANEKPEFRQESCANDLVNALNEKTEQDSFNFASCSCAKNTLMHQRK